MFPREGKYKHAACFTLRRGIGGRQDPHGVLVCNFPDPSVQLPALMDHSEVVTFFHEFGHLIHVIMEGRVPWVRLTRVNEWDFIEAPSQFLEEWIYDYEVLRRFARHIETGAPIPEQLVRRMREARDFARAVFVQRQLWLSAISLYLHDKDPRGLDPTKVVFDLAAKYSPTKQDEGTHLEASFGHLEGYTALYYTYMLSLVVAKDFLTAFRDGLMDTAQARRYRDLILAPGGTKPAPQLARDFLGRDYSFDAFRRWLSPRETSKA
jgi:thimet oligopeptidase